MKALIVLLGFLSIVDFSAMITNTASQEFVDFVSFLIFILLAVIVFVLANPNWKRG